MEISALLSLYAADRAICSSLVGPSYVVIWTEKPPGVFSRMMRNGAYRFTPEPLFCTPFESLLTQSDCLDLGKCSGQLLGQQRPPLQSIA